MRTPGGFRFFSRPSRVTARPVFAIVCVTSALASGCDACGRTPGAASSSGGGEDTRPGSVAADGAPTEVTGEHGVDEALQIGGDGGRGVDGGGPACTGAELEALAVLGDPRCAISAMEARRLRAVTDDAGAGVSFVQRATLEEDGSITVRVTNRGTKTVTVPLLDHADLPAFTALGQEAGGALYELAPPSFAPSTEASPASDGGDAGHVRRARIARARVPAGGSLVVRLAPSPVVMRRIDPPCPDGGRCAPERLAPGAYVLHLGQLVVDVEAGPPARVAWLVR